MKTHRIGKEMPDEPGIYDMSGNVKEWCSDWYYTNYYGDSPEKNPQGPSSGTLRVIRGGSWVSDGYTCRVTYRSSYNPDSHYNFIGFRCVK